MENIDSSSKLKNPNLECIFLELTTIHDEMVAEEARSAKRLAQVHINYRESARNLIHYLVLRRRDLRLLQRQLATLGLSSLGRSESHVLATVESILDILRRLIGHHDQPPVQKTPAIDFSTGRKLLSEHTDALLGTATPGRNVRIMVTMPSEAADQYPVVQDLLKSGMDCMRINCAHDDSIAWARMIEHLRRAELELGRSCRVVMDLAGPKLRTGPLEPGPALVKIHPRRDVFGRVIAHARVWLTDANDPHKSPSEADACLPVPKDWLARLHTGEHVRFRDARGSRRTLVVVDVMHGGCWAEATKTAYIIPGITLSHDHQADDLEGMVGDLPATESPILLHRGDLLILTRNLEPGRPTSLDGVGKVLTPAQIGCTIPEVFESVRTGESIWFDDGKIGGFVEKVEKDYVHVRISHTHLRGAKLRADKGINLPESDFNLPALTPEDLENLPFLAQHADVIELSFSGSAEDVESLQSHLERLGDRPPAIVVKIETHQCFDNLPDILLTAMRSPCCGVMIARGDLAIECGYERLAEVQEEILWICEAAHVPVIWATQVLETLAKEGMPSRAEITDAAMGDRAECVMLNKGPHVLTAVRVLDDILRRMQAHQIKKSSLLRKLELAHALPVTPETATASI